MHQSVGELIRQLRRQQSFTQTELGGERFSKSYVSAVERGKIVPSSEALHFFADQLGQEHNYLMNISQEIENEAGLTPFHTLLPEEPDAQKEFIVLLDRLFEINNRQHFSHHDEPPLLSENLIAVLPKETQASYLLLLGLATKARHNSSIEALRIFEQALSLAPELQQPTILDEMGLNYYEAQAYQTALGYHKRGLQILQEHMVQDTPELLLCLELHCANDYRALGAYQQARTYYEQAREHLSDSVDLKTAAQIYVGLGYCIYACTYQSTAQLDPSTSSISFDEVEREFQRAVSFLVQSRTLYQVSGDSHSENMTRLLQAMILLDLCSTRRSIARSKKSTDSLTTPASYSVLLNDAEEQCHQVLMTWQETLSGEDKPTLEVVTTIYTAIAYQIRILAWRAAAARAGNYVDTAKRERLLSVYLCEQVLDTFTQQDISWQILHDVINVRVSSLSTYTKTLPRTLSSLTSQGAVQLNTISQIEVYTAIGEVAEEVGRAASTDEYARTCYQCANEYFQAALNIARLLKTEQDNDPGILLRRYQHYVSILEERILATPIVTDETTKTLLNVLKDGLVLLQSPIAL